MVGVGPKIIKRESFQLIGYHLFTNLKEMAEKNVTEETIARLMEVAGTIENRVSDHIYLLQIYPMMEEFNPLEDRYSQIIGFVSENCRDLPDTTIRYHVEENLYVHWKHDGAKADSYKSYDYLYNQWMVENRCIPLGYEIEVWNPKQQDAPVDIYIAISKLNGV